MTTNSTPEKHSLDAFVLEMQEGIIKYKEEYLKKHEEMPEEYPLVMTENNSGLWYEFLMIYLQEGLM